MRPKKITYTLAALDAAGFLNDAQGVGPWTTILANPGDGCGHLVTIASGSDISSKTLTVTGTDPEGRVQTEAITGPNATTVTGTKYFLAVTSVAASATIGAATMDVGWDVVCATPAYPTAVYQHGAPGFGINLGGAVTYTAQQTNDRIFSNAPAQWHRLGTENCTVDQSLEANDGTSGVRALVSAHTSGFLYLTHSQARN